MIRDPGGVLVIADEPVLDVARRLACDREDERPCRVAAFDHIADIAKLRVRVAPPLADVRQFQPAPHERQVVGCKGAEVIAAKRHCYALSSASMTTLVLV